MIPVDVYWNDENYEYFLNNGKKVLTHSIVALAFLGDTTGYIVRHLDGDTTNNRLTNLQLKKREEVGEVIAKDHLVQCLTSGKVTLINNWFKFEGKDTHRILRTFNKDKSISYSAPLERTTICNHVGCSELKANKKAHCQPHVSSFKLVKKNWKRLYEDIAHDNSDTDRNKILELLDLTTEESSTYGVNIFLQLSEVFTVNDVKMTSTITNLSGYADIGYSEEFGEAFDNNEYFGDGEA